MLSVSYLDNFRLCLILLEENRHKCVCMCVVLGGLEVGGEGRRWGGLKVARSSPVILRTDSAAAREGICVTLSSRSLIKNGVIMLIGFPVESTGSADVISRKKEKEKGRVLFHYQWHILSIYPK